MHDLTTKSFRNGPAGVLGFEAFHARACAFYPAMVSCDTYTVAVGGYNIAAIESARVAKDVDYISTAVVAFLEYVEGKDLSAFAALSNLPTNSSL